METEQTDILKKIDSGELKKKPKWQFVLQARLVIIGVTVLFIAAIFLISFVYELLVFGRPVPELGIGSRGFGFYLLLFPWIPVLVALLLTAVLGLVLQQYTFIYRKPLVYLLIGIIVAIGLATFILHITSFHQRFSGFSTQHKFPMFRQFYGNYRMPQRHSFH